MRSSLYNSVEASTGRCHNRTFWALPFNEWSCLSPDFERFGRTRLKIVIRWSIDFLYGVLVFSPKPGIPLPDSQFQPEFSWCHLVLELIAVVGVQRGLSDIGSSASASMKHTFLGGFLHQLVVNILLFYRVSTKVRISLAHPQYVELIRLNYVGRNSTESTTSLGRVITGYLL